MPEKPLDKLRAVGTGNAEGQRTMAFLPGEKKGRIHWEGQSADVGHWPSLLCEELRETAGNQLSPEPDSW